MKTTQHTMRKISSIVSIVFLALAVMVVSATASAVNFDFTGGKYQISDSDGNGVGDTLNLQFRDFISISKITSFTPDDDGSLGDDVTGPINAYVNFTMDFIFDETNPHYFNPSTYENAFQVRNIGTDELLMEADVYFEELVITGSTAGINPYASLNLYNVDVTTPGVSAILDAFIPFGGALTISLQASSNLETIIQNLGENGTFDSTYSGSAKSAVPEPSTFILMGVGLLSLAGYGRKRFAKKS